MYYVRVGCDESSRDGEESRGSKRSGWVRGAVARAVLVNTGSYPAVVRGDLPEDLWSAYARSTVIAWDIETSGLNWREDRIGTCQLFSESVGTVVISVNEDKVPGRLTALLQDPSVVKVFHHAPFDLRFMVRTWGVRPASVQCTKVASKLLEPQAASETHSLQYLLGHRLGVHLSKGPVRVSNWSAATLSADQIEYAAADVMYLPPLLKLLLTDLAARNLAWLYDECCAFLPALAALEVESYPDVFSY
jgi:ribonuclease D